MNNHIQSNFRKSIIGVISLISVSALLLGGCGGRGSPSIKATPQTIQFTAAPSLSLHGSATVTAIASSGLPVTYSSNTTSICSVNSSSGLVTSITVGTCLIAADQSGNDTFAPAPQATQSIATAFDSNQTITFGVAPTLTLYGTATVSANSSSNLPVSYSSNTTAVCSVDTTTGLVTDLTTGNCIIVANQAGDANYNAAPQVTQTLTVPVWSGPTTAPGAPSNVSATLGNTADTVVVSFDGPSSSGGSPVTGYTVTGITIPGYAVSTISATGLTSPISIPCSTLCTGYSFTVAATNGIGIGTSSPATDVLTNYDVVTTFFEPDTQPNNTIFTGTYTLNSTTQTISNLRGSLTESMTHMGDGLPMNTITLSYQLSSISDGAGGVMVTTFAQNNTQTFSINPNHGGTDGWSPGTGSALFYGYPTSLTGIGNPQNAYVRILLNLTDPTMPLTQAQIDKLAYADCTLGGMMGATCMTGTTVAGYGTLGSMSGYPTTQVVTKR